MTNPVTSPLIPSLTGRQLTVDAALKTPTLIRDQIARLADPQILLPKFLRQHGAKLQGGALLYNSVQASDFFIAGSLEQRMPGTSYAVVEGVDPTPKLAAVEDWGGKFEVPEEAIWRNNVNYLDQQTTQLSNEICRKLDTRTVDALQAADIGSLATATTWNDLVFVGPLDQITASADRPTAHFAEVQEMADLEELGVVYDLLVVHPEQARQLRTAYADRLDDMLASAGFTNGMFVNPRLPAGTAYVCQKGNLGVVGFEVPLTVETWRDPATRQWIVQAYCVPAFAIDRPYAAKKITGLS
ncbi:hypothetical protein MSAS_19790 [Mycobacterium saskatchewanense]|uniref:DUF2184 domain-containing protein n=1 Tax=Mycobacterium saskatchewanense TaxID=220927 RepID=A0AAJ3NR41_9MYCO|nr:major capsid protein [Mycobacterium saskatchewanense]ORW72154.1 hypothetical protein AWC23_11570 [Mycobacterium saskatchewanense]BBX62805.1 hypothetical protein MSAS_19790 [Mycobacterium saskatchewanense]